MNFHNMCSTRESKRKRETYQFHGHGCVWRGSGVGGGGLVSRKRLEGGFVAEIGGEKETQERKNGGVAADIGGEREGEA